MYYYAMLLFRPIAVIILLDYALGICNYTSKASLITSTVTLAHARRGLDCHLVARTCDNEVGVAISIRDPYTSPFTSR